jgi:hypothetical protein
MIKLTVGDYIFKMEESVKEINLKVDGMDIKINIELGEIKGFNKVDVEIKDAANKKLNINIERI